MACGAERDQIVLAIVSQMAWVRAAVAREGSRRELLQHLVDYGPDRAQRIILPRALLREQVTEHVILLLIVSLHARLNASEVATLHIF